MEKSKEELRIVFMGTSQFAAEILSLLLIERYNIVGIYTRQDKKAGRSQELKKSDTKLLAEKYGIKVYEPERFSEDSVAELKDLNPDLIIVAAYGKILPKSVLDIARLGSLNVHASLLPKFRGPSPIQNTLLAGEEETGITIMLMDEGIDTGDIIAQEKISIGKDETYEQLHARLAVAGSKLLVNILPLWAEGKIKPEIQKNSNATICQLIEKSDGKINWTDGAEEIYNRYRAFKPWPGVYAFWEKDGQNLRLRLNKISFLPIDPEMKHHVGEVFLISDKVGVQANSGFIILEEVQLEGRSNLLVNDFMNGNPTFVGSVLK